MIGYHNRIKRQFGRSAQGQYDSNVRVQLIMAAELAERVQERYILCSQPYSAPRVLEIGCGTGTLTALLVQMQMLGASRITAIDISPAMLEAASRKLSVASPEAMSRVHWVEADAERWAAGGEQNGQSSGQQQYEPYALIVSNACFQWFVHPARTLAALRESLSHGGLLAFTTFGPRTMHELHTSFQYAYQRLGMPYRHRGLTLQSLSAWRDMLRNAGFRILEASSQEHIETHRSVPAFLHTVKAIGASASSPKDRSSRGGGAERRLFREMFQAYESLFPASDGTGIAATYETLTILAARD